MHFLALSVWETLIGQLKVEKALVRNEDHMSGKSTEYAL